MKIDYPKLNATLIRMCPGILAEWFPQGVVKGREFVVGNVDGEKGKSLSVNIETGVWKDFATGQGGDLVELYAQYAGCSNGQAAEQLISKYAIRDVVEDEVLIPIPRGYHREAPTKDASVLYEYLDVKGELLFYIMRIDRGDGNKTFVPLSYWRNSGWQKKMPPGKRSLYGLQLLAKHPKSTVIVVEGEKSADAGLKLSSNDYTFVTWPNGSSAYKQANWNVLAGRDVMLWPDADDPGIKAMNGLAEVLKKSKVKSVQMLSVSDKSGGWDSADAVADEWSVKQFTDWLDKSKTLVYPLTEKPDEAGSNIHFRPLGYSGKSFVFYIQKTGQVVTYKGTDLERWGNLYSLAPANYWDKNFNDAKESVSDAMMKRFISNSLIRQSEAIGYHDPSRIRGRGVWEDDGRSVLHLGNRLIVDGSKCDIRTFETDYIYEQRIAMHIKSRDPLDSSEAAKLVDLCNLVRWDERISGFLLAGWIFSSIICGVLPWRSHIYLMGPVGSGKTWVMTNIITRCLRGIGVPVQGKSTSEPGLRQTMKGDARPVLFDESEAETRENIIRMQKIYDLARQASSEGAAPIIKGTQNQVAAIEYVFRSCFVFASIQPSMTHYADESRITLLRLGNPDGDNREKFQKLLRTRNETLTDNFCDGLISRAVLMAPIIRHNHRVFAEAGEEKFGSRRASDQFAMMLAGLYSLSNDRKLQDHDDAKEFMFRHDWEGRIKEGPIPSEITLLETILQTEVQVEAGTARKMLGELVAADTVNLNGRFVERDVLRRRGLKVVDGNLYIANSCVELKKILKDTPWADKWNQTLINTQGAEKSKGPEYFAAGIVSRAVIIPMPESLTDGG